MRKLFAEVIGTFTLVLFGCGTAIIAGQYVGYSGISFAFGLSVLVMAYAVGPISGGHFNPAVTLGAWVAKRIEFKSVIPYILAQLAGAAFAATLIYTIVTNKSGSTDVGNFAANTYTGYSTCVAFLVEAVLTFVFLVVILGSTSKEANSTFAPIAIGLALVCIHLVSIPVTNTSVNPARSTSQVLFSSDPLALEQLWLFWVAPIVGAMLAGLVFRFASCDCCCKSGECATEAKKATAAPKPAKKAAKKK